MWLNFRRLVASHYEAGRLVDDIIHTGLSNWPRFHWFLEIQILRKTKILARMNAFGCQVRWLAMILGCCYCRKYWTCDDLEECLQPMSLKTIFFQTHLVGRFFNFAVCPKNQPVCNQEMSYRLLQVCVATAWCMKVFCPSFKFSGIATIFTPKV